VYAGSLQELEDSSVAFGLRSAHANQRIGREAFPAASKLRGTVRGSRLANRQQTQ
jgi:hypothetical protein